MKISRAVGFALGLLLGGFSFCSQAAICHGFYSTSAQAQVACAAVSGSCSSMTVGGDTACGATGTPGWHYVGTQSHQFLYGASCPAGQIFDANGMCVPGEAGPSPEAVAAGDAAAAAAAADGYDQAAQDAAKAAAESAYTDWIAAGKTVAEAEKAAAASGVIGAVENMQGRMASVYAAAQAAATACIAAGNTGCGSYYDPVDAAALAMGWDTTNPPGLCFGVGCSGAAGPSTQYIAKEGGGWSVIDDPGDGSGLSFGGHVDGFPLGPTQAESTTYGSYQPAASEVVTVTTENAGGKVITQTSDGGGALVVARSDGVTEIYYFDPVTHQEDAVAVVQSNGASTCVGDCTGKVPVNDVINAGSSVGGGGASGLLPPGGVSTLNKISDAVTGTGDGAGSTAGIDGEKGAFDGALNGLGDALEGAGAAAQPPSGWTWFPTFPAASCEVWNIPRGDGGSISIDPCPAAQWIRDVGGYLLYFMTALGLFNILTGKREQT